MLPVPVEQLSGPLIVGYLLNWGLFGTLSVQLYLYYLAFPKDRRSIKSLVYGIYIVEFVQTVIITYDAFALFGYGFGNMEALTSTDSQLYWLGVPIIGTIAASVGQGFYAYRIYILSRSGIVPAFVICVSLTSFVAAIVTGAHMFQASDIIQLNNQKTSISFGISCACYALCDIVIAICMTYNLMRHNTSFPQTRILITKLIRLTIETGSLTAVVALAALILFFAFPNQIFYVTPGLVISKLYANSIYMVLNSRIRIMGGRDIYTSSTDMEITTTMMREITSHSTQGAQRTPTVVVSTEVFSSDHEMGRMDEKPQDSDMSLLA